jgi:MFS family permease
MGVWTVEDDDDVKGKSNNIPGKDIAGQTEAESNFEASSSVAIPYPSPALTTETNNDRIGLVHGLEQSRYETNVDSNAMIELANIKGRNNEGPPTHQLSMNGLDEEHVDPPQLLSQGIPPELKNLLAEITFVLVCSAGQFVFCLIVGHITVTQTVFRDALGIPATQTPWLVGSTMLASGLSVIISGSLADLAPPKPLMVGAFLWEALWNAIAAASISPKLKVLFFVARAMKGLAIGVLVSVSMSILGRVYKPGIRKTRAFSLMAATSPFGFWIGCIQGGALSAHLPWIFGSTAMFLTICAGAAYLTIPPLSPAKDGLNTEAPSLRQFDFAGAALSSLGCGLILFGLTQGSSANWNPYTYSTIILGAVMLAGFYFVEQRVARPLIPNELWKTPGFAALMLAYFLGYGAYSESLPPLSPSSSIHH